MLEIASAIQSLADRLAPEPPDTVGTDYVRARCGHKSTQAVTQMIARGEIPASCIVDGSGGGKPWRFYRDRIDKWLRSR